MAVGAVIEYNARTFRASEQTIEAADMETGKPTFYFPAFATNHFLAQMYSILMQHSRTCASMSCTEHQEAYELATCTNLCTMMNERSSKGEQLSYGAEDQHVPSAAVSYCVNDHSFL